MLRLQKEMTLCQTVSNLYCSHCDIEGHSLNNCNKRNDTSETVKVLTTANEHSFAFKAATVEQIMGVRVS